MLLSGGVAAVFFVVVLTKKRSFFCTKFTNFIYIY